MRAKGKLKESQRKAKGLPELNLSHTTSASLLEAQLIAYYLRELPGETRKLKRLLFVFENALCGSKRAFSNRKSNSLEER